MKKDREGRIGINLACLRNVGVLSVGSLHVWGGALHVAAVVREILVHWSAESNLVQCREKQCNTWHYPGRQKQRGSESCFTACRKHHQAGVGFGQAACHGRGGFGEYVWQSIN